MLDFASRISPDHFDFYLCLIAYYLLASSIAFAVMGHDKLAARKQRWRVPENSLHLISVVGGWPGTYLACLLFRHKIRKSQFQIVQFFAMLSNFLVLAAALKLITSYRISL